MMTAERFAELAPWYVNGSLSATDRTWVDNYLTRNPEARSELAWFQSLQTRIKETIPEVPATIGLNRAMARIRADQPTLAERFGAFVASLTMKPALSMALAVVVLLQGGVIVNMMKNAQEEATEMRALRGQTVEEGPLVKVNFAPDARESDIRMLLVSVQGTLAGGPGQLGDYYVRVPAGKEAAAAAKLKGMAIVQAVELAPGIPPRD
jgi:hypothetical protein